MITSVGKGDYVFGSVGLFVCLSVCCLLATLGANLKSYEWIAMKFYCIWSGKRNKWLDFNSDLDHHADCPIGNPAIIQQII